MVDFHTHILPNFDDGAEDVKASVKMLSALKAAGFDRVVLSSHYYSNACAAEDFVKGRQYAFDKLKAAVANEDVPKLHLGAEVYLTSLIFNNEDLIPLTVDGSGVMLTELPYDKKFSATTRENIEKLVYNHGLTVVLAHIERYPFLLDKGLLGELYSMGCRAQVNIEAFCGRHRRKLKKLADKGFLFAFGTDAHSMDDLDCINDYLEAAEKAVGKDYLNSAFAYTKEKLIRC
ncbi:MAG: hypothetical protein E7597_03625 [Ruminococcaceae bacterium]|nr:hypothetical protein [Oscillospiraceae bacterium]